MSNQTLNYSFQCIEYLTKAFTEIGVIDKCHDLVDLLSILDESVKFILPNRGEIIEEFKEGKISEEWKDLMHLPFDIVAFEYPLDDDPAPRRITLVFNLKSEHETIKRIVKNSIDAHKELGESCEIESELLDEKSGRIYCLTSFFYVEESKHWECSPMGMTLTIDHDVVGMRTESFILNKFLTTEAMKIEKRAFHDLYKQVMNDGSFDLWVTMQAMCVLNCENIKHIDLNVPEKLAKSRAKKGLKPFHDYKVLSINAGGSYESLFGGVSVGSSKRAHLRRGHLRRLRSGNVTYVRSTVVGAVGTNGFIEKDYKINKQKN